MSNSTAPLEEALGIAFSLGKAVGVRTRRSYLVWKGIIDRALALIAFAAMLPLLGIIALAIRLDSPGNPLLRRQQIGEGGKRFTAYKFRTMYVNNDDGEYRAYLVKYVLQNAPYATGADGRPIYKVVNDPRVTRLGAWLRRTNLDELPQLVNVLKGEMSLVGPRPDIPFAVAMYKDWHRQRLQARPGITGLWQICGRKGLSFEDMVRLDLEYIENRSLLLDLKIMLKTLGTILRMDGSL